MTAKRKSTTVSTASAAATAAELALQAQLQAAFDHATVGRLDKAGRDIAELFRELPDRTLYPDYFQVIASPIALDGIQNKIKSGAYGTSSDAAVADFQLMVDNALQYNEPQSQVVKDARELLKHFKRALQATVAPTPAPAPAAAPTPTITIKLTTSSRPPSTSVSPVLDETAPSSATTASASAAPPTRKAQMLQIFDALLAVEKDGYRLCELFEELPDKTDYPDYYELIKKPIAFEGMKRKILNRTYRSVDDFERDIILMVNNAKTFNEPGSAVHQDAIEILDHFYRVSGRKPDESKMRTVLTEFVHNKVKYEIGDFVYLFGDQGVQNIAQVREIWKLTSGQVFFLGQWYLRPEYTVHPVARRFYKQEVFRADRVTEHLVSEVQGKCYVYFIKDFMRGRPPGFKPADEKDVFLCESRYIEKGNRMEKIKNWKTGDEPDPLLVPFVQPIFLEKMASPFATEKEKAAVAAENAKLKAAEMGEDVSKGKSQPVKSAKPQPSPALRAGQPLPSPRIAARGQQHQPVPPLAQGVIKLSGGDDVPPETVKQFDHKGSKLRWYSAPPLNIPRAKRAFETLEYAAFKKRRAAEGGARRITSALPVAASAANPISASNPVLVQRCAELMGEYAELLHRNAAQLHAVLNHTGR